MKGRFYFIFIFIITICLLLFLSNVFNEKVKAFDLKDWMVHRALYVNDKAILHISILDNNDKMTYRQAVDRVGWLKKYSYELNYMYPDIHPKRVFKDIFALCEVETRFIKYASLDNGLSYGIMSMQTRTALEIADKLNVKFDKHNTEQQIMFGVYYYYYLLKYYKGDRHTAILGYNVGMGLDTKAEKYRNYLFLIIGRLQYYESLWKEMK